MTIAQLQYKLNVAANEKDPEKSMKLCRDLLSDALDYIYETVKADKPKGASLLELLDGPVITDYVSDAEIIQSLHFVRVLGMNAVHGRNIRKKDAKLALDNCTYFIGLLAAKAAGTAAGYVKPPYMTEEATRRLYIDLYLREAGWDVLSEENVPMAGKAGIEIEVHGMPTAHGIGYCDYVLYGRDGKPLAIVEAKKTSVNIEKGRHQVDLYAECMKKVYGYKPVMYYTNGYTMKIIDGIYPDRYVYAFHTLEELERMIQRRGQGPITDMKVNKVITSRPYQEMAITSICESLNAKHRRGLIIMATGTGKTRVSISLVDVLARNHWIKNVLFLADRTALVSQAKRAFDDLLPGMSICELSGSGEKDLSARLMFCTYQTMINYIDAEDKVFTSGRFDLIIIDEAHRSVFNRYGTIFNYFDSLLVGLTATPKSEVSANTYSICGCETGVPNFDYSLEEAIKEKYLVGYNVINRTSNLIEHGIDYSKLTQEEKDQLQAYLIGVPPTPDFTIPAGALFTYLYNKRTCCMVLEELMKWGLRVENGETMGKTIIFAYNHKHAEMIVNCFRELWPDLPANYCQLVDYSVKYGDDLVVKFDQDPEFRIAVSVDMLDTGVDIPAVLNLVFFKKIRSKIKFVQMIGRGTRLCKDVYGPGKNKTGFQIFDYCGNFEYFKMHVDGKDGKEMITTSQRLFEVRLNMLMELQRMEYQQDSWMKAYYESVKKDLHNTIVTIKAHSSRMQVRLSMGYVDKYYDLKTWQSLSPVMVQELKAHLLPLIDSGVNGDFMSVAFDVRMYYIELSLLATKSIGAATNHVKTVREIARYLIAEKASVPQVLAKAADLKKLAENPFWIEGVTTIPELERLRISLRDLMQFLKGHGPEQVDIDIPDEFNPGDPIPSTQIDIRTYREKVMDYLAEHSDSPSISKIHNLEPITNEDLQELERVMWEELGSREEYYKISQTDNLAAFVRSLVGLSQEAVNEQFGDYLNGNVLNSRQQEFVKNIIEYVRENGDIQLGDMVEVEPFCDYDILDVFGINIPALKEIINKLHDSITVAAPTTFNLNAAKNYAKAVEDMRYGAY